MAGSIVIPHTRVKPLMVYDGECHFCCRWITRWHQETGDAVDYAPLQEAAANFPEIPRAAFQQEVKLIEPDGRVYGGAEAVFEVLCQGEKPGVLARLARGAYHDVPGFAPVTEVGYHFVARHRTLASTVTRLLWGNDVTRPTYATARTWFLRALGLVYFLAFLSMRLQVDGLVGHEGILPFAPLLDAIRKHFGAATGIFGYPTLCWLIGGGDGALHFLCDGGMVLAALLVAGIVPVACLALLWVFYLSVAVAGQTFLGFQWDILLLETGFLSLFLAPWRWWSWRTAATPATLAVFGLRWLLFRLMLMSGLVKLASGDAAWLGFSALYYHYETQPLPTWLGWYAHQAPHWFQNVSCAFVLGVELIAPFFVFGPCRVRLVGFVALVLLQVLIAATGNYCFFNLLTAALCLLLLDDKQWPRALTVTPGPDDASARRWRWPVPLLGVVAAVYVVFGTLLLWTAVQPQARWPAPLATVYRFIEPFETLNGYGLFRVMTRERPEIVVEGSNDGQNWLAYGFRWKPGELDRRPRFVAPYQPRLDWQMWFAALGSYQDDPWFTQFLIKLLQGSPPVLGLLAENPFPHKPPRYIRALEYDYHFTDRDEHARTGAWWRRDLKGLYCPVYSLPEPDHSTAEP